jgi:ACT domain-containing protein
VPRRFLTAEDVRRLAATTREIVLDEDTLATPQALEAAAGLAIVVRSGPSAAYREPVPDRGPDAERAMRSLPKLPEPKDEEPLTGVVITAVGKNRPGVLAEITATLAQTGGNIHDISQKMIEGYFHMVLSVELAPGTSFGPLKTAMECLGGPDDYVVRVMHERVFRFMHRI